MNSSKFWALSVLIGVALIAGVASAAERPTGIIPYPLRMEQGKGTYVLNSSTVICVKPGTTEMKAIGAYLAELLAPATGLTLPVKTPWFLKSSSIVLMLDKLRNDLGDEGYTLKSTGEGVTIVAAKPAGIFYGVQTLRQLLPVKIESTQKVNGVNWEVPCVTIEDKPRFKWRGYLIDPARQFRTKDELKRYIDLLALHKLNIFQLHLTDDQGWRVEIKKYPKLVETWL